MSEKNIYQRINAVMKEVEYVKKDASVSAGAGGTYKAVTHDMVLSVLRASMVKHGIVVKSKVLDGKYIQLRDLEKGIKQNFYCGRYEIAYVNTDNPEDILLTIFDGHGLDSGDKAPGKATSIAVKYSMLKTFSLETGESEESRSYEAPTHTDLQLEEFNRILDRAKPLEYVVFSRKNGAEVMMSLQKTFPDGKISAMKKQCKQLESDGWDKLREYVDLIAEATEKEDSTALRQLAGELIPEEKQMLVKMLREKDIKALKAAQEAE